MRTYALSVKIPPILMRNRNYRCDTLKPVLVLGFMVYSCWLSSPYYIWTFAGPVLVVIVANSVLMFRVIMKARALSRLPTGMQRHQIQRNKCVYEFDEAIPVTFCTPGLRFSICDVDAGAAWYGSFPFRVSSASAGCSESFRWSCRLSSRTRSSSSTGVR